MMKNKKIGIIIITIAFCILFWKSSDLYLSRINDNNNRKIAAIIEKVIEENPGISKNTLMEIVLEEGKDEKMLEEYGIFKGEDAAIKENENIAKRIKINGLIDIFLLGIIFYLVSQISTKRKNKKLEELTKYLEQINEGDYSLDVYDNSEDRFSLLKNEIYKTAVRQREQKENAEKGKILVKDSISDISHQLKTPLTSISIMTEILEEELSEDEKSKEFARDIKTELIKVNFLVRELLKLAKFDADTVTFSRKENDLYFIACEAKKSLLSLAKKNNVKIDILSEGQAMVNCDMRWQKEAISNIIKNSIEHSKDGGKIIVFVSTNKIYSEIVIKDEAGGMCEKDKKHIFDRFYKGKNSSEESVGIGMHLAKTIIEKDDGVIFVETNEGRGSIFTIRYFR